MTNPLAGTERIFQNYDPENDAAPVSMHDYNLAIAVRHLAARVAKLESRLEALEADGEDGPSLAQTISANADAARFRA